MEVSYFELPNPNTVILPAVYAMAAATVIVVMFVTYLSTAGILKEKAADMFDQTTLSEGSNYNIIVYKTDMNTLTWIKKNMV